MGQGLQVWDENGVNLVDTDYRLTQIIGSVYTADLLAGNAYLNGSIHVPEFATLSGNKFVHSIVYKEHIFNVRYPEHDYYSPRTCVASSIRIEGNYIRWLYETYTNSAGTPYKHHDLATLIIWGVF